MGRCAVLQQKHVYPAWANTHQERADLLPARSTPALSTVGDKRLKTSGFCSSLGRSTFYPLRSISLHPPAQPFLFFWRILVEVPSVTPPYPILQALTSGWLKAAFLMCVCSSHTEGAIGPKRVVPAATRKKSHLYRSPPTTPGCKHPFATVWRTAGLSRFQPFSQPSLKASLLPRSYICTRHALENIRSLIQNLMKSKGKKITIIQFH